jgi:hypothetical protein
VWQNAGVVDDALDGSHCYHWGLNGYKQESLPKAAASAD